MRTKLAILTVGFALAAAPFVTTACQTFPAPWNQLRTQPAQVYRLQDAPQQPSITPPALPIPSGFLQSGAGILSGLGLGGFLPGGLGAPATAKFHGFPIYGAPQAASPESRDEIVSIFADPSNFTQGDGCMVPEVGFEFAQGDGQTNSAILVSLRCSQVRAPNFAWPHGDRFRLTPEASKRIAGVLARTFPN